MFLCIDAFCEVMSCLGCVSGLLGCLSWPPGTGMQGHGWRGGHAPFSFPEDTSVSWAIGRFCLLDEQQRCFLEQ